MGGGGGDGDGERACFDDLGLAPREAGGEPSCFDFGLGSGLFVSPEEAPPESLSVTVDFGLEGTEEEVVRRRGGHRWCGGKGRERFTILARRRVAQLWKRICRTVFSLYGRHRSRLIGSDVVRAGGRQVRREEGRGEKWPNKEGSDDSCPLPFYFIFSSPTLSKPSVLKYFVPSSRSVAPIRSAFPIIHRTLPKSKVV